MSDEVDVAAMMQDSHVPYAMASRVVPGSRL